MSMIADMLINHAAVALIIKTCLLWFVGLTIPGQTPETITGPLSAEGESILSLT